MLIKKIQMYKVSNKLRVDKNIQQFTSYTIYHTFICESKIKYKTIYKKSTDTGFETPQFFFSKITASTLFMTN